MKNFEKALIGIGALFVFVCIIISNSCAVVKQRERGVQYTLGKVTGEVIEPGLVFHAPFISKVQTYSIAPKTFEVTFTVGSDGAITKDMQTVGTTVNVKYNYDPERIMDIAKKYGDSVVESAMKSNIKASVKEVVGTYSIYDLIEYQADVTKKVESIILNRMKDYPIEISQTAITNWDWSDDFDSQIKETAIRTQQVKQAEQELKVQEQKAQQVKINAQANLEAERLNAEAIKVKADADYYAASQLAKAAEMKKAEWKHEEQMKYLEKWNGIETSNITEVTADTYKFLQSK